LPHVLVIDGIPSNGTMVIVGNGEIGTQPVSAVSDLLSFQNVAAKPVAKTPNPVAGRLRIQGSSLALWSA